MNTTTPSAPQPPAHSASTAPRRSRRPGRARVLLRRLARIAGYAAVRGAATTAGGAAVTAVIWWIHNR